MTNARSFTGLEARRLLRRARTATLASLNREDGIPYASLVNVATDARGSPIVLISKLAWHTRNLLADSRASVLVAEPPAEGDALTGPRVTVLGRFVIDKEESLRRRYLARHPEAEFYAGFGDFDVWKLKPELVQAVAGFGRIETLPREEVFPDVEQIAGLEDSAIAHMNADHREAVKLYVTRLLGAQARDWKVAAIDCDGADLVCEGKSLRLEFPEPVFEGSSLRQTLASLAASAKSR